MANEAPGIMVAWVMQLVCSPWRIVCLLRVRCWSATYAFDLICAPETAARDFTRSCVLLANSIYGTDHGRYCLGASCC